MDRNSPEQTFRREGQLLRPTRHCCPGQHIVLHRIMVGSPRQAHLRLYLGTWRGDDPLTQYNWSDGTLLTDRRQPSSVCFRFIRLRLPIVPLRSGQSGWADPFPLISGNLLG